MDCSDGTLAAGVTPFATYTSQAPSIFTVDASGNVSGVSGGTANLVITYGGLSLTQAVTVLAPSAVTVTTFPNAIYADSQLGLLPSQASVWATFAGVPTNVTLFNGVSFIDQGSAVGTVTSTGAITPSGTTGWLPIGVTYGGTSYLIAHAFDVRTTTDMPTMVHHYSFQDAPGSTTIVDSIGGANGTIMPPASGSPVTLTGDQADFPGGTDATAGFIALPPGIIGVMGDVTIEMWAGETFPTYNAGFFAAGTNIGASNPHTMTGGDTESISLNSAQSGSPLGTNGFAPYFYVLITGGLPTAQPAVRDYGTAVLTNNGEYHMVGVYSPNMGIMNYYINGVRQDSTSPYVFKALSTLHDQYVWLGFPLNGASSAPLAGWIHELRIYEGAMTDAEVAADYAAGPGHEPVTNVPVPTLSVALSGTNVVLSWPTVSTGFGLQTNSTLSPSVAWGDTGITPATVGTNFVVTIPITNKVEFYRLKN